jgi:hypothetical protein
LQVDRYDWLVTHPPAPEFECCELNDAQLAVNVVDRAVEHCSGFYSVFLSMKFALNETLRCMCLCELYSAEPQQFAERAHYVNGATLGVLLFVSGD